MLASLEKESALDSVGGKALSLARMIEAGLPVPQCVVLTTSAYFEFVQANELDDQIKELSIPQVAGRTISFEYAEQKIGRLFRCGTLPKAVLDCLAQASGELGTQTPLAVRSSATAEDLKDTSFAGLHRTHLNVVGDDALVQAVLSCWASLWCANSMMYRYQLGISSIEIAMAVVIQSMIPSEASGVAFTANPATGDRSSLLINASFGLGEAIVSGDVDPDLYKVDRHTGQVIESQIHAKKTMSIANQRGGVFTEDVEISKQKQPALSLSSLKKLTDIGLSVEHTFHNQPQDIEWAIANDNVYVIQSRPITGLPPVPIENIEWKAPEENALILRHQLVEHVAGPVCTLFEETYLKVGLQEAWGRNLAKNYPNTFTFEHSQPPWCFIVHPTVNGYAYKRVGTPKIPPEMEAPRPPRNPLKRRLLRWRATIGLRKRWIRRWMKSALPKYLKTKQYWEEMNESHLESTELLEGIWALARCEADHWFNGIYFGVALNRNHEIRLNQFLEKHAKNAGFTSSQLLSGFDSLALNAQVELSEIARSIRSSEPLFRSVLLGGPARIQEILQREASDDVLQRIQTYLQSYGRQVFTLDFVEPAPIEDPVPTYRNLFSLVVDAEYDFDARRQQLKQHREETIARIRAHFGPLQRLQFRRLLLRVQRDYHLREEALSYLGQAWPALRRLALELGMRLKKRQTVSEPEDIFYLTTDEISKAIGSATAADATAAELQERAANRKLLREAQKFLNPPLRIGHDPNFPDPPGAQDLDPAVLKGSAVSSGVIDAPACVILDTKDFDKMQPGCVLVCPATSPAWTPLFPLASALVTDIGGLLAHGSIIAREYGIPAVLGLGDATRRISTGDMLTVDGNQGTVQIHDF
ncbi:MAG: PEP-utilizing enzyme [Gammaproteobacteria bacterium]|nr:PEP-utilizing enzyme [Gammaproteobacteria bacterium]